jgi:molecular chaperone GrpE
MNKKMEDCMSKKHKHAQMNSIKEDSESLKDEKNVSDDLCQEMNKNDEDAVKEDDGEVSNDETKEENGKDLETEIQTEKEKLTEAEAQIADLKDRYLRSVAEFDNYRKRTLKEKTELILNGGERVITAILPVVDDLERALSTMDKVEDVASVKKGVDLIYQKFSTVLKGLGLKRIDTQDEDFNTDYHEAIAMVPVTEDDKKGKIIDCVQSGYMLNDKVIRHAKVAVGQ